MVIRSDKMLLTVNTVIYTDLMVVAIMFTDVSHVTTTTSICSNIIFVTV